MQWCRPDVASYESNVSCQNNLVWLFSPDPAISHPIPLTSLALQWLLNCVLAWSSRGNKVHQAVEQKWDTFTKDRSIIDGILYCKSNDRSFLYLYIYQIDCIDKMTLEPFPNTQFLIRPHTHYIYRGVCQRYNGSVVCLNAIYTSTCCQIPNTKHSILRSGSWKNVESDMNQGVLFPRFKWKYLYYELYSKAVPAANDCISSTWSINIEVTGPQWPCSV